MKGITIGTYRAWKGRNVTKAELRAISDAEVASIYRANYWNAVRGDELPAGLDLLAFDPAVNSGVSRGAKWLQGALGVTADGRIGPQTIAAAKAANATAVIDRACDARLAWLRQLKTWRTFGKGWTRRVESVRDLAHQMASQPVTSKRPAAKPRGASPETGLAAVIIAIGAAIAAWMGFR